MTVIFDLDYTLLDTSRFKEALSACLEGCGIGKEEFLETYGNQAGSGRIRDYDPDAQIEALASQLTCGPEEARRRIGEVAEGAGHYLVPGAVDLLDRLRSRGHRLILFTHGNAEWQRRKIEAAGLRDRFDRVVTAAGVKEDEDAFEGEDMAGAVMINDNGEEIMALKERWPEVRMVAVRGPKGLPDDPGIPVAQTMDDIRRIIDTL